jgi:hypothetical protein
MKQLCLSALALGLLLSTACKKTCNDASGPEGNGRNYQEFVVAKNYGLSGRINYFKLSGNQLYAGTYNWQSQQVTYNTSPLPATKFSLLHDLATQIPGYLLQHPDTTFGCLSCADQPSLRIIRQDQQGSHYWNLDVIEEALPQPIRNYTNQLSATIDNL